MTDSPDYGTPLPDAINWISGTMTGSVATTIAILAIAMLGILLLGGRLPVRRGALVVVGCAMLFSASTIARGIVTGMAVSAPDVVTPTIDDVSPVQVPRSIPKPYDPYAGATVPLQQEQPVIR